MRNNALCRKRFFAEETLAPDAARFWKNQATTKIHAARDQLIGDEDSTTAEAKSRFKRHRLELLLQRHVDRSQRRPAARVFSAASIQFSMISRTSIDVVPSPSLQFTSQPSGTFQRNRSADSSKQSAEVRHLTLGVPPKLTKQTFRENAGLSIAYCASARTSYDYQLSKGKARQMARRTLAYNWLKIIQRCWKTESATTMLTTQNASRKPAHL